MNSNDVRSVILKGAMRELRSALDLPAVWPAGMAWRDWCQWRAIREDALAGVVVYAPSRWMGRALSVAERKMFSRVIEVLEEEGLVERIGECGRTTHVRLRGPANDRREGLGSFPGGWDRCGQITAK